MNLFEIILVANLGISLFVAYTMGRMKGDIETLYEGLAMTMQEVGIADE